VQLVELIEHCRRFFFFSLMTESKFITRRLRQLTVIYIIPISAKENAKAGFICLFLESKAGTLKSIGDENPGQSIMPFINLYTNNNTSKYFRRLIINHPTNSGLTISEGA